MTANRNFEICPVSNPSRSRDFLSLRRTVYRNDPAAVFPLRSLEKVQLDTTRNPFYQHADMQAYVCYRNGNPIGRIAAIQDHLHNQHYNDSTGFFGFFELIDDQSVAKALLETANNWLSSRGSTLMRGPVSPSMKSEFGVLVEGYQSVPSIMMGHTPPYYHDLLTVAGFEVVKRFFAYRFNQTTDYVDVTEKWANLDAAVEKIQQRFPQLQFRTVDRSNYDETFREINQLGNQVRSSNYGFVPLTEPELNHMIAQLKRIIRFDMIHAAYWDDRLVGFIVNIPDVNWALRQTWGRYDWIRIPQLLYWIKRTKRTRVIALGVHEEFRKKGIAMVLIKRLKDLHDLYQEWEFSWVVEDNLKSIRAIGRTMPLNKHRVYQLYERQISPPEFGSKT